MKLFYLLLILLFLPSCFLLSHQAIDENLADYEVLNRESQIDFVNKLQIKSSNLQTSINSHVKLSSSLGARSLEQVFLEKGNNFRLTWYAPNYLSSLAYYVSDANNSLFCDFKLQKCWEKFPEESNLSILSKLAEIPGFNFPSVLKGIIPDFSHYSDIEILKNTYNDSLYLIKANEKDYRIRVYLASEDGLYNLKKLFLDYKSIKLVEMEWFYNEEFVSHPKSLRVMLPTENVEIVVDTKKLDTNSDVTGNIFEAKAPKGFTLE